MKTQIVAAVVLVACLDASVVRAHSGGTDASGCHVDSSTGTRHCHGTGGGSGGGLGPVDPLVLYGIGYASTIVGTIMLTGFAAYGQRLGGGVYLWPGLLYAASEALAIAGFVLDGTGDPLHFGVLTGLNVAGAIGCVIAAVVFSGQRARADDGPRVTQVSFGAGALTIAGVF